MFIRKKKNRSGTTSVVVVDKRGGFFREMKTMGVSSDDKAIRALHLQGKKWISACCGDRDMFAIAEKEQEEKQVTEYPLNNVENI
ncbi:MAG: hypothetical protein LBL24_07040 [Bacteroidales bacterium]|jgi:hypothetical protein|nr:hypothetical protein [Bacteroidales bacterium]